MHIFLSNHIITWITLIFSLGCFIIFLIWLFCYIHIANKNKNYKRPTIIKWIFLILCLCTGFFSCYLLKNLNVQQNTKDKQTILTPFICIAKANISTTKNVISGNISIGGPSISSTTYCDDYSIFLKDPAGIIHRVNDMQLYFKCNENDTIKLLAYVENSNFKIFEYASEK